MITKKNMNLHKKIVAVSAVICSFTIIFGFCASSGIFNYFVKNALTLKSNTSLREIYLKYPFPIDFCVYFFNVTNPDQVHIGKNPIVREIGPFCYDLYKARTNIEDDDAEDTLTYSQDDRFYFNAEKSNGLSDNDFVTILHPVYVSLVNVVEREQPSALSIVDTALGELFKNQTNIYLNVRVRDVLFDGMKIDCTSSVFSAMAVCSQIKARVPGINEVEKDIYTYSLMKNFTLSDRIKINRGIKKSRDLGRLRAINNETKLSLWNSDECNEFKGTDGWIFPPLSTKETRLWIHSTDLCRNINADLVESLVVHGIPVKKYDADYGDVETNSDDRCYCSSEDSCLPKGLFDATKCTKVPIIISLPHFLRADPKLLNETIGLEPDTEKHITRILFEGTFAVPLEAHIRAQFNLPLKPLDKITLMQNISEIVHPVLWIEIGVVLGGEYLSSLQAAFTVFKCLTVLKYLLLVGSLLGLAYGGYFLVLKKINKVEIKKIIKNDIVLPKIS